jgi:transketolase C-terminal domain/subunit
MRRDRVAGAFSISATIAGVANTGQSPLPIASAVFRTRRALLRTLVPISIIIVPL